MITVNSPLKYFGLIAFYLAFMAQISALADLATSCSLRQVRHTNVEELAFWDYSFARSKGTSEKQCSVVLRLTDSAEECVNRLMAIYSINIPQLSSEYEQVNDLLTVLSGVRLIEPISIIVSNKDGAVIAEDVGGLQIQFNWKFKKAKDRIKVVFDLVSSVDRQLKALCPEVKVK